MKKKSLSLGLIALTIATTACSAPQRTHPHYTPTQRHNTPPPLAREQRYIPEDQQQYSQESNYSPSIQMRQSIIRLAYQELGTHYKYGGSSPREGFDCSGLMAYIHKNGAGIKIPRTAAGQ